MKKYFFKYIIEFLVVFLGITISFSLQQLSNNKENSERQKEGLERVLSDLKLDETIFELTLDTNQKQINASNNILDREINNDIYNLTIPYFGTFLNDTAIKSLIATGLIEGFANQDLITGILKYYRNDYDFIIDQSEADERLMFRRLNYILENFEIDSVLQNKRTEFGPINMPYFSISENILNQIRDDKVFRGHLNNMIYIKLSYNNFVKGALEYNGQLQKKILEELSSF
ncbi:hypothetical protein N8345_02095 [Flavobacteriaceae bacterium]|nr:hypothetical protein [Flavobacteriaceae bacterium]MDC1460643.1 hypothetical protein [Flavobacteriaceae bacterium]